MVDTRSYDVVEGFLLGRPDPGPVGEGAGSGCSLSALGRPGRGASSGGIAGALAAPPPPPPTLRPRIALRGIPRVEPCGCVAFAAASAVYSEGGAGGAEATADSAGSGGVLCCTAASRESTVAILRYEPSEPAGCSSSGGAALDCVPGLSWQQTTPSGGLQHRSTSGDANEDDFSGGGASSSDGFNAGSDNNVAISVFQTAPLPADSHLRAPSPVSSIATSGGNGGVNSPAKSSASGGRRSSSAGPSRPGGSVSSSPTSKPAAGGGGGGNHLRSPGPSRRPPAQSASSSSSSKPGKAAAAIKNQPVTFNNKIKSSG